ncbi:MAG: hypothetical protein QNM02_03745 [Acidimicrobiia bacterium]|nr:hypothetical protein [Acidimicrobiia bacterium]
MSTTEPAQGLFDDLLNIEIDVIVGGTLGREAMPVSDRGDPSPAMRETLDSYVRWLDRNAPAIDDEWSALASGVEPRESALRPGDGMEQEFEWVAERAECSIRRIDELIEAEHTIDPTWPTMLRRIRGNALQLGAIAAGDVDEAVDRIRIVRKAWELGTGTIVAQTVVQLDGDAVSRVDGESILADDRAALRTLHGEAVRGALEHWQLLVDLLVELVRTAQALLGAFWPPGVGLGLVTPRSDDDQDDEQPNVLSLGDLLRKDVRSRIRADWVNFKSEVLPLFTEGGVTVESANGTSPYARTVIQSDGDALWFVSDTAVDDDALLAAHVKSVGEWYEVAHSSMRAPQQLIAALRSVLLSALGFFGLIATVSSIVQGNWQALLVAGVMLVVVGGAVLLVLRFWLGRWLRDKIGLSSV